MGRNLDVEQGLLFGDSPLDRALSRVPACAASGEVVSAATRLPKSLRLGTSSWSFPGWRGLIYGGTSRGDELARFGLGAYGQYPLFRTVGLDRAFYSLLSRGEASGLADLVPDGFRFLVKAHQSATRPDADPSGSTYGDTAAIRSAGHANPHFLDASSAVARVVAPLVEGFRDRLGPIVFQFPPLDLTTTGRFAGPLPFIDRLAEFLDRLPKGPAYVVEVRNREFFAPDAVRRYSDALAGANAAHGFAVHPTLPSLATQAAVLGAAGWPLERQPALCIRWLLGHGQGYDEAKRRYEPFNRIVDPDPVTRSEIVDLLRRSVTSSRLAWVVANNKAEGCAPRSLEHVAQSL